MVRLDQLTFSYAVKGRTIPVLSGIGATFERGAITAIVGRSGCGKSTLLRLIAGLAVPDSGTLSVDGEPGGRIRPRTSIIFQDYGLLPWESVRGNAELGLAARGMSAAQRRALVAPILEELELNPFSKLFPARLSGGMRQRVAVARALAGDSDLLLLDEPFSSLDAITRESLQETLLETQRRHGTTVILVTHSIEEAAYLADVVYIMEGKNPSTLSEPFKTGRRTAHHAGAPRGQLEPAAEKPPVRPAPAASAAYREDARYFEDVAALRARFAESAAERPAASLEQSRLNDGAQKAAGPGVRGFASKLGKIALAAAFVALIWGFIARVLGKPFLPRPETAAARFAERLADGTLIAHTLASLRRIFLALAIAGPLAWALGLVSGRSRAADALASPLVYLLHPLPKVAFLPLLMLFLGLGDASKIALMGLVIFGQLFVGARDSARAIQPALLDTVRSLGFGRAGILRRAIFPATLPALLSSLRISLGTAIAVLFLSETFASMDGLGWYIMDAWSRVDYPDMYAAIMALSAVGLALYLALDAIEALALRWRDAD
jgi:ABC-type nitrate/sulfonate/bicarbonate transport system ATPase subunit/ABC-type nitrate/sulfonate/bicarbonate transport system permease component